MKSALLISACLISVFALGTCWIHLRWHRLSKRRRRLGIGLNTFQQEAAGLAAPGLINAVYSFFESYSGQRIPVAASDDLLEIFGLEGEDIADELGRLAKICALPEPSTEQAQKVRTIRDVLLLLEDLRSPSV